MTSMMLLSSILIGQTQVYLDENWEKSSRSNAQYIAFLTPVKGTKEFDIEVKRYPSLEIWSKGRYNAKLPELKHVIDTLKWFHPNGAISQKSYFKGGYKQGYSWEYHDNGAIKSKRYYKDGKLEGEYLEFNSSSDTIAIKNYVNDSLDGDYMLWNKNHVLFMKGHYKKGKSDGHFDYYFGKDSLDAKGEYVHGSREGTWVFYHKNGQLASEEQYKNDTIVAAIVWDESGNLSALPDALEKLNSIPTYQGGEDSYMKIIREHLKYPEEAIENNIQGKVFLQYTISNKGEVLDVTQIGKTLGYGLDEAAFNAGKKLKDWKPGMNHNRNHPMEVNIPIKFVLK